MAMKRVQIIMAAGAMIAATACTGSHMISVTNPSETDREEVMAEIDADAVVSMADGEPFRLIDKGGEEIPYQLTYDDFSCISEKR